MLPYEMEPFFPVLIENKTLFRKIKRRHHSTQPIERKAQQPIDSFYERSFVIQRKELQCRTLEPKKQIFIQYPKTSMSGRENINDEISFEKLIQTFLQVNSCNPSKQSSINKKAFKLISQNKEIQILEEEHKSLQSRFFKEINSYVDNCRKF
ncbi:unnamed protein product [Paramecium pentaurelia]|uniref:Uncharacterized protein n=1 Tax=Paramecium pentaurelia TaxID=43138 RepID=A0A8S1S8I3_9CILI|nr:unnamed protein product [Paramecium pentaurelia]